MPRYYKRTVYRGSRDKYSVEQQAGTLDIPAASQAWTTVVPDTATQGMRKVKHLTVSCGTYPSGLGVSFWALVYVPQGTSPNTLNLTGSTGMYEPNQFVMNCGVVDFDAGPARIPCPISRNLNSGDKIVLIMTNAGSTEAHISYCVRYAITLQ